MPTLFQLTLDLTTTHDQCPLFHQTTTASYTQPMSTIPPQLPTHDQCPLFHHSLIPTHDQCLPQLPTHDQCPLFHHSFLHTTNVYHSFLHMTNVHYSTTASYTRPMSTTASYIWPMSTTFIPDMPTSVSQVVLNDVQHTSHLREQENSVSSVEHTAQWVHSNTVIINIRTHTYMYVYTVYLDFK